MSLRAAALGMALALAGVAVIVVSLKWMQAGHAGYRRNPIGPAISLVCLTAGGSLSMLASALLRYPRIELSEETLTWRTLLTEAHARWVDLEPFRRETPPFGAASENESIIAKFAAPGRDAIIIELRRFRLSAHTLVTEFNTYRDRALARATPPKSLG